MDEGPMGQWSQENKLTEEELRNMLKTPAARSQQKKKNTNAGDFVPDQTPSAYTT